MKLKFHKLWNCSLVKTKNVHKSKKLSCIGSKVETSLFRLKVETVQFDPKLKSNRVESKVESDRFGSKVEWGRVGPKVEPGWAGPKVELGWPTHVEPVWPSEGQAESVRVKGQARPIQFEGW